VSVHSVGDAFPVRDAMRVDGTDDGEETLEGEGAGDVELEI
jgi:hypothetical protein